MTAVRIIAEIGINHNGCLNTARQLVTEAARSGASGVKFQYRNLANVYSGATREIGDEILSKEIARNYLDPDLLLELADLARSLDIEAGISFFEVADMEDFGERLESFDFFKVPSVELTNRELIDAMLATGRPIFISTGGHSQRQVNDALGRLSAPNWMPFHCISNYPTAIQNARLGYIHHLREHWGREVGYSSHDDHWEVCLIAMQLGARVIERHITLDKAGEGLDHSSSSTPDEFARLSVFAANMHLLPAGNEARSPNQGELVNLQNLGRSYYAVRDISAGETLTRADIVYRSPKTGLGREEIEAVLDKEVLVDVPADTPLIPSAFHAEAPLEDHILDFARAQRLSLPVRLHDLVHFQKEIPISAFEFHLSFEESRSQIDVSSYDADKEYSVHLPDYINPTQLMDPFSPDSAQRVGSLDILDRTMAFAKRLQDLTGKPVPVVGSFSVVHGDLDRFYADYAGLIAAYRESGVDLLPQWLPPIAWYFGGSVRLQAFNALDDVEQVKRQDMAICMDVCHLLMGQNFHGFSAGAVLDELQGKTRHVHIADAAGFDAEGLQIGEGEPQNLAIIERAVGFDCMKVIEVWQGHFDRGAGFKKALAALYRLHHG